VIKKKFKIPLYFHNLIVIQTDDFQAIEKEYGLRGGSPDYAAITFETDDAIAVCFNSKVDYSIIAHESVHVCSYVFLGIGAKLELNNDETFAYLMGWVVEQIHSVVKIAEKDKKQKEKLAQVK